MRAIMSGAVVIQLSLPGRLQFCDVARRVIMESCKLVGAVDDEELAGSSPSSLPSAGLSGGLSDRYEFEDRFTLEFISAFSEIYNNIALHAYDGMAHGTIDFKVHIGSDRLIVEMSDMGKTFDIDAVPVPDELPTGGMGIYIARTMLDELEYQPGPPNRWRLAKYMASAQTAEPARESAVHE